jgi:hypothetical protein
MTWSSAALCFALGLILSGIIGCFYRTVPKSHHCSISWLTDESRVYRNSIPHPNSARNPIIMLEPRRSGSAQLVPDVPSTAQQDRQADH